MLATSALLCLGLVPPPRPVISRNPGAERDEFLRVAVLSPLTLRSAALSLVCPMICAHFGILGRDFDPALLSLAIATPSGFSINAAYARRERCFVQLAEMRAAALGIHHAAHHWGTKEDADATDEALYKAWGSFTDEVRICDDQDAPAEDKAKAQVRMYTDLAALGSRLEDIRRNPNPESREHMATLCSMIGTEERLFTQSLEQVRVIASTRTPFLLRGFTISGATLFPIIFAPYFAAIATEAGGFAWSAYLVSILFALSNGALVAIQVRRYTPGQRANRALAFTEALEDPLDGDTMDDIRLSEFEPPGYDKYLASLLDDVRDESQPAMHRAGREVASAGVA